MHRNRSTRTILSFCLALFLMTQTAIAGRDASSTGDTEETRRTVAPRMAPGEITDLQAGLDRLAAMDPAQWETLEVLVSLDDEGWLLLRRLLSLSPAELQALASGLTTQAQAGPLPRDGDRVPESPDGPAPPTVPDGNGPINPDAVGINTVLSILSSKIDSARSKIDGVRGRIDTLLPDAPNVRNLFQDVPLSGVIDTLNEVKDVLGDLLATLDVLREGYDSFDDAAMKNDLMLWLDDLEELWQLPQELACFDDPDRPILELKTDLLRKLIDRLPKVALLAMQKMLDTFSEDWRTSLREILDTTPMDLREGICTGPASLTAWSTGRAGSNFSPGDAPEPRALAAIERNQCKALRKAEILGDLRKVRAFLRRTAVGMDTTSEWLKDDDVITLGITAVGGGTAGKKVKLPAKPTFKTVKALLEGLSWRMDNLLARRDSCLANDDRIERDLVACTALATYVIDLTDARDLAERRVEEMSDAGEPPSTPQRNALDDATTFMDLCTAYRDIVLN